MSTIKNITVPDLGSATDVTVIEILVKPGDSVQTNASLVTLESDKATLEVPASDTGTVKDIKVKVGDKVSSGAVILTLEAQGVSVRPEEPRQRRLEGQEQGNVLRDAAPRDVASAPLSVAAPQDERMSSSDAHAGPGVRQLARELGVDLALLAGTGPKSRILKEDVQQFVKSQLAQIKNGGIAASAPMPTIDFSQYGPIEAKPLSRIKKISGKNLLRNWNAIPHVTQFGEADITDLEEFRLARKAELEKKGVKLTPIVFVMKAVVASLKAFPQFNASLDGAGENLIMKNYFHLGVAVDTPDGLVVPVIRDVDKKSLTELAKELGSVSEKARNKQLAPGDMQGGCFSISSLGGIGGTAFTPIINAPEVAILGVSKTYIKPVYIDNNFVPRLMLPLSLSYDHRVIDGADGARFIVHLTQMLSDIRNMLV